MMIQLCKSPFSSLPSISSHLSLQIVSPLSFLPCSFPYPRHFPPSLYILLFINEKESKTLLTLETLPERSLHRFNCFDKLFNLSLHSLLPCWTDTYKQIIFFLFLSFIIIIIIFLRLFLVFVLFCMFRMSCQVYVSTKENLRDRIRCKP